MPTVISPRLREFQFFGFMACCGGFLRVNVWKVWLCILSALAAPGFPRIGLPFPLCSVALGGASFFPKPAKSKYKVVLVYASIYEPEQVCW